MNVDKDKLDLTRKEMLQLATTGTDEELVGALTAQALVTAISVLVGNLPKEVRLKVVSELNEMYKGM
jgi:hypothetical protein